MDHLPFAKCCSASSSYHPIFHPPAPSLTYTAFVSLRSLVAPADFGGRVEFLNALIEWLPQTKSAKDFPHWCCALYVMLVFPFCSRQTHPNPLH
jgi:hypothetical protein